MTPIIIAEAGVNHNGDLGLAKELIDVASEARADYVKFQTFSADTLVTKTAPKARYQITQTGKTISQHGMLKMLELPKDAHHMLKEYCDERSIGFLSTGFDVSDLEFLMRLDLDLIKIPSGEITNLPLLRFAAQQNKRIVMSTGMANLGEIEVALSALQSSGQDLSQIVVMHCCTQYPTPLNNVNLNAMKTIEDAFKVAVGYSDHTLGIEVAVAATALGASVIEKHFTVDKNLPGPDHKASLTPPELSQLVSSIRGVSACLGSGIKIPALCELENIAIARKSIVAKTQIRKGDIFNTQNITTKRPGTGISPMRWDEVVGTVSCFDFDEDELIKL